MPSSSSTIATLIILSSNRVPTKNSFAEPFQAAQPHDYAGKRRSRQDDMISTSVGPMLSSPFTPFRLFPDQPISAKSLYSYTYGTHHFKVPHALSESLELILTRLRRRHCRRATTAKILTIPELASQRH